MKIANIKQKNLGSPINYYFDVELEDGFTYLIILSNEFTQELNASDNPEERLIEYAEWYYGSPQWYDNGDVREKHKVYKRNKNIDYLLNEDTNI